MASGAAHARFLAEPAWQTFSFFIPLYLVEARDMDLKGIAAFASLLFLAADAGLAGSVAWIGGLSFSLIIGALADTVGYNPLFVCLALFDIVGAAILWTLLRGRR